MAGPKTPGLLVIARYSSFGYKGRPVDIRSVARELSVRYVIEGSVRRAATAALAQLGRLEGAKAEAGQFLASHPHLSMQHWADTQPFRHDTDRQHFIDGYVHRRTPAAGSSRRIDHIRGAARVAPGSRRAV
jgi:hypothetical protein